MKKLFALAVLVIAIGLANGSVLAGDTWCTGELGAVTVGNLIVAGPCILNGTTVTGNLTIEDNGDLAATDIHVSRNVNAHAGAGLKFVSSEVGGNVQIKRTSVGYPNEIIATTINGNLQLKENNASFQIRNNTVDGHVKVYKNNGGINLRNNNIRKHLQCKDNHPAPTGGGNTVDGKRKDQCAWLDAALVAVPQVLGKSQTDAEDTIFSVYLTVGIINTMASDTVPAGHVVGQNPVAGTWLEESSPVDLTISLSPAPTVSISADPETIHTGQATTLTWTCAHANTAAIEPDIGQVEVNGATQATPVETTTYTITVTGPAGTSTADVTVAVVNTAPVAGPQSVTTVENESVSIILTGSDADNDPLTFTIVSDPSHGTLSGIAPDFVYTPYAGFSGTDSFTYAVSDDHGGSDTATVTIQVDPGNLEVVITSPVDGSQFSIDAITITGTVSRSGASVFVNGAAATVNGSEFTAESISLFPGTNMIVVLAEDGFHTAVAGISVVRMADMDLEPIQIETTPTSEDDGSLKVSGQAIVTVANHGSSTVTMAYTVILFEDVNISGRYEEAEDNLLGETRIAEGPGAGEAMNVSLEFVGELLFRDNRMHAFIDSAGELEETNEDNNVITTPTNGIDLSASQLTLDDSACPENVLLTVRMGNAGAVTISPGISVAFYDGDPKSGGILIGTAVSTQALEPGQFEDMSLTWTDPPTGTRSIHAITDDDGTGTGRLNEPNEENNRISYDSDPCPPAQEQGISGRVIDAVTGTFIAGVTVSLNADDNGSPGTLIDQFTSDDDGYFVFSGLNTGEYILAATSAGYITAQRRAVLVSDMSPTHHDLVLSPVLNSDEIRIILTWGEHPVDLEAHLTAPNPDGCRWHCFYWNKEIAGAHLDLDDKDSYGPETITVTQTSPGVYHFYVHDFTNRLSSSSSALADSEAIVTVYAGSGDEPLMFGVPSGPGTVWHVFDLDGDSGEITPVDRMTYQSHPGRIDFPLITSSPETNITCGETYTYQITAIDPDSDTLTYSLVEGPYNMTLDPFTGLIQWAPTAGQGGRWHDVEVRVNDDRCGEDSQTFKVYVTYRPLVQFSVDPCSGMNPGGDITLTWQTDRADTVVIDQGIGEVAPNGSLTLHSPTQPVAFTLTAENSAGITRGTVPAPPSIDQFKATVNSSGDACTLAWQSSCATTCEISQGIGIVSTQGTTTVGSSALPDSYTLTCSNGGGSSSAATIIESIPLMPVIDIKADPKCERAFYGDPITLTWIISGIDVQSCEITPDIGIVPLLGSMVITPTQPTIYSLVCTTPSGGVVSKSMDELAKLDIRLSANPPRMDAGEKTTLSWRTDCATGAVFDKGIGEVDVEGSIEVAPADLPATYTLTASNEQKTLTKSVTIKPHLPTATFNVSPAIIKAGEGATLSWATDNTTSCSISPDIGEVAQNGTITVQPEKSTRYTLTAIGPGGTVIKTATATYIQPVVEIHADPKILDEGKTTTLTWVFSNADIVTIDQGIGEVQLGDSIAVDPEQTTTYTITATGPGGTATDSVTVTCLEPTVTINAAPTTIIEGTSTSLSWNADHAAMCAIEPSIGTVDLNGSMDVSPAITTTYTATASGRGGEASARTTVTVVNPPSIALIEPDGNEDKAHKSYTIKWTDKDHDSDATITLFYDINTSGADGVPIADGISENLDGQYDQYIWDTTNIPAGAYYVYAVIEDGANDPMVAYSDGVVIIDHAATVEFKILASDGTASDYFGSSVAIDGDYAVVGAPSTDDGGAVYVFRLENDAWVEQFKLKPSIGSPSDQFGASVSINGDTIVVGAPNANESRGVVYVFTRDGSTWVEQTLLTASDRETSDNFGISVAISGETVVVGAPHSGEGGAVYAFKKEDTWVEQTKLTASDNTLDDNFGTSVSFNGDTLIVGSPRADNYTGAAYVFRQVGSNWLEETKLVPGSVVQWERLGNSVSLSGEYAIVGNVGLMEEEIEGAAYIFMYDGSSWVEQVKIGAFDEGVGAGESFGNTVAINGDMVVVGEPNVWNGAGAVYLFKRTGSAWVPQSQLIPSDGEAWDGYGSSVALSNDHVIVGSNGDDDKGSYSGSAYIYPLFSVNISADPEIIRFRGELSSTLLSWTSRDAGSVRIDPDIGPVSETGSLLVYPQETTTYTITANKGEATATDSVTVQVIDPTVSPTVQLSATPETIVRGTSAALSWLASNVETVVLDNGIGEASMTGTFAVSPAATTTYTVTATNENGTATASVTIAVTDPPPTVTIAADPGTIPAGEATLLSWTSSDAEAVSIEPGIGSVDPSGSISVSPMGTTTYVITAMGPGGTETAEVTVTVTDPLPVVELSAASTDIVAGEVVTLTWTTTHADTVSIEPDIGPVDPNGTLMVTPMKTTTYTLTATGAGGTGSADVTVTVYNPVTLQITSPLDGANVSGRTISVKGSVAHADNSEAGVTVNGIVAMIAGNQFIANHVPLTDGENDITAKATDAAGIAMTDSITIDADIAADYVLLTADSVSGMAPFETTLKIDGSFDIASSQISYVGPDTVEFLVSNHDEYRVVMTTEGIYTFTVQVEADLGYTYRSNIAVEVVNEAALDELLQEKWAGMKSALIDVDIEKALTYHYGFAQERYSAIYNAFGGDLPTIIHQMQPISPIYFEGSRAKYRIRQDQDINGQTVTITYYIYFSQDENGIWKIEKY